MEEDDGGDKQRTPGRRGFGWRTVVWCVEVTRYGVVESQKSKTG